MSSGATPVVGRAAELPSQVDRLQGPASGDAASAAASGRGDGSPEGPSAAARWKAALLGEGLPPEMGWQTAGSEVEPS